ncbi:MAG: DNA polymerase IV [Balneolaceae bacterium]|nr:DNA polymerase IV [Balneolaceae bacterium]
MPKKKGNPAHPENDVHRITLYNTVYPEHQHRSRKDRLYLHFDFACYYAQVEQLRKRMYGVPLIVGGWRKENGVVKGIVATASYEARAFGIKTGMSALEAYKLCPYVCMLQVDYATYTAISKQVHHIMKKYSHQVERYSMDEYFMDLTFMREKSESEIRTFVRRLQNEIYEATGLFGALGIARSKTYAKLSSSLDKPRGISIIITDDDERAYIYPMDLNEVWGVGGKRYEHLRAEGYQTIGDVATKGNIRTFIRLFGANFGRMLFQTITGKDEGRILEENDEYSPKWGVSYGHTFSEGSKDVERIKGEFAIGIEMICYRMRAYGIRANSFSGMFGYNDTDLPWVGFRFVTDGYTNVNKYIYKACMDRVLPAISKAAEQGMEIRNLMIGTHQIDKTSQMNLFFQDEAEHVARYEALDEINNRYGKGTIISANTLHRVEGNTHFLERNA